MLTEHLLNRLLELHFSLLNNDEQFHEFLWEIKPQKIASQHLSCVNNGRD